MRDDFFKNLTKNLVFSGYENRSSAFFNPDAVVSDEFDYAFGIK